MIKKNIIRNKNKIIEKYLQSMLLYVQEIFLDYGGALWE